MPIRLDYLKSALNDPFVHTASQEVRRGRVIQVVGTIIKAVGVQVKIGEICILKDPSQQWELKAEVVGFAQDAVLLTPLGRLWGVSSATEVIATGEQHLVPVGKKMLGRIIDGLGNPLDFDSKGPLEVEEHYPIYADPPNPLERTIISEPLSVGVSAIDGLITCCQGQRLGIFAGAGQGKSTLLAMLARGGEADAIVLALIGERGREVREFIEETLGEGLRKSVVIVSTSDRPSMERVKAAYVAMAIAEYLRDQGKQVVLMMDSVTRFARAQRELGLSAGEPPTRRGYPPSLFTTLPLLLERAGRTRTGCITALYTVLVEGDDLTEPVADEMKSLLDGHIVLSDKLAHANHYPAIDVLKSISRVMGNVVAEEHRNAAGRLRSLLGKYQEIELLVRIGEYQKGSEPLADEALEKIDAINDYLKQGVNEKIGYDESIKRLMEITKS
ncbi:MAG: type III secretion system ATPase SctN [Desulfobacteraceae bacterium]|jgi:type III secretion protein N (ATPase)